VPANNPAAASAAQGVQSESQATAAKSAGSLANTGFSTTPVATAAGLFATGVALTYAASRKRKQQA